MTTELKPASEGTLWEMKGLNGPSEETLIWVFFSKLCF